MRITSFKDMYIAELQELADMERQLATALRRMADIALHAGLKRALADHFEQTTGQRERLRSMVQVHGASPTAHTDQAMQALIRETEKMFSILKDADLRDAGLIASAQKLEHYEIAAYGTAAALAGQLDLRNDQCMLHETLQEEKEMDLVLSELAKSEVNRDALAA
jgi:ferritin-like metal-binding protein YciE